MITVDLVKNVVSLVTSIGAGMIVSNIVKATTPENIKLIPKLFLGAGVVVVSGIVTNKVDQYVGETIDNAIAAHVHVTAEREKLEAEKA